MSLIDDKLAKIVADLGEGKASPEVSVRDLLDWVDASRRGYYVVLSINEALTRAGLVTIPNFEAVHIDSPVQFALQRSIKATSEVANTVPAVAHDEVEAQDTASAAVARDPTIRISRFIDSNRKLIWVKPDDMLRDAVTQMLFHDFSQLPVMINERNVKGVISWNSIGARLATGAAGDRVRELMDFHVIVDDSLSLFDAIPLIVKHQYVLVRASDQRCMGIITSSDLGLQFRQLAEPFLLLGEIENYIRRAIASLDAEELAGGRDPNDSMRVIKSSADLSLGEYIRLLQSERIWQKVGLPIDRKQFCDLLERARRVRNDVMHFDPDGIESDALEVLRHLASMFQRLSAIGRL